MRIKETVKIQSMSHVSNAITQFLSQFTARNAFLQFARHVETKLKKMAEFIAKNAVLKIFKRLKKIVWKF